MKTEPSTKQKVILYARTATTEQDTASQIDQGTKYAEEQGYDLVAVFSDRGFSGSAMDRPGIQQMLTFIKEHPKENFAIILDNPSILSRNPDIHIHAQKKLEFFSQLYQDASKNEELTTEQELVEFNGSMVIKGWPEKLKAAQEITTCRIDGVEYERIPYGQEEGYKSAGSRPCHDCSALKGQLHVPGCDMERCPVCKDQAAFCDCDIAL
ncbi:recombinase family protein [Porticoccus sp. W117]|uniref:recombinase family protein n=1 Tax=Porticoccus sp. W117 TaxID=3054777 RepID=UPI0025981D20|nr:recombinase family protein [Porticoccus sp. W117]MDM3871842.1 recombinase family protein [Porticoccus sp. W117]